MASPMENVIFYPLIYDSFPLFGLLQTLKLASDLTQGLLVIAWKEYHLNGTRIPKPRNYIKKKRKNNDSCSAYILIYFSPKLFFLTS